MAPGQTVLAALHFSRAPGSSWTLHPQPWQRQDHPPGGDGPAVSRSWLLPLVPEATWSIAGGWSQRPGNYSSRVPACNFPCRPWALLGCGPAACFPPWVLWPEVSGSVAPARLHWGKWNCLWLDITRVSESSLKFLSYALFQSAFRLRWPAPCLSSPILFFPATFWAAPSACKKGTPEHTSRKETAWLRDRYR